MRASSSAVRLLLLLRGSAPMGNRFSERDTHCQHKFVRLMTVVAREMDCNRGEKEGCSMQTCGCKSAICTSGVPGRATRHRRSLDYLDFEAYFPVYRTSGVLVPRLVQTRTNSSVEREREREREREIDR